MRLLYVNVNFRQEKSIRIQNHFEALGGLLERPPPLGFPVVLGHPPAFPGPLPWPAPPLPPPLLPFPPPWLPPLPLFPPPWLPPLDVDVVFITKYDLREQGCDISLMLCEGDIMIWFWHCGYFTCVVDISQVACSENLTPTRLNHTYCWDKMTSCLQ